MIDDPKPAATVALLETPFSANEPPGSNVLPPTSEPKAPASKVAHHGHAEHSSDPDELEDEIDEAVEGGDAKVHKAKPKGKR